MRLSPQKLRQTIVLGTKLDSTRVDVYGDRVDIGVYDRIILHVLTGSLSRLRMEISSLLLQPLRATEESVSETI